MGVPLDLRTIPQFQGIAGPAQQLAADPRYDLSGVIVRLQAHDLSHELEVARLYGCWLEFRLSDASITELPKGSINY